MTTTDRTAGNGNGGKPAGNAGKRWQTVAELAAAGVRGHVYRTRTGIACLVTRNGRRGVSAPRVIGSFGPESAYKPPRPERDGEESNGAGAGTPAAPAHGSRHLVVTGVSGRLALTAAVDGARHVDPGTLRRLAAECGLETEEVLELYSRITGWKAGEETAAAVRRILDGQSEGGARTAGGSGEQSGDGSECEEAEPPRSASLLVACSHDVLRGAERARIYRFAVHGYARAHHGAGEEERRRMAAARPLVTETAYDALFAAVAEHCARLAGDPVPAWCGEPGRFLDEPHVEARTPVQRVESLHRCPPSFLRHGYLIDPESLDSRGGERHAWGSPR